MGILVYTGDCYGVGRAMQGKEPDDLPKNPVEWKGRLVVPRCVDLHSRAQTRAWSPDPSEMRPGDGQ